MRTTTLTYECILPGFNGASMEQLAKSIEEGTEEATGDDAHRDDVTALMVAAQGGHLEMVELLVERGGDVRAKDEHNFTPLLNAVKVKPCYPGMCLFGFVRSP